MTRLAAVALVSVLAVSGCGDGSPAPVDSPEAASSSAAPRAGDSPTAEPTTSPAKAVAPELQPVLAGRPERPDSAAETARFIIAAQRVIHDSESSGELVAAAGHTEQLAYQELSGRPAWDAKVLARVPAALRRVVRDNVAALRAFRSMHPTAHSELADELPVWRVVEPIARRSLRAMYGEAERRYGIDWEYLAAINMVETTFGRIRGTSVAGAQGPMQFIPGTWDMYGEGGDVHDPRDAIMAAARLLRANGFARDKAAALYRYNNSTAYVKGVTLHAEIMRSRPRAFRGYHQWQVYYLTRRGSVWLPTGYASTRPMPVDRYLERHPERLPG
ncbi:lytic transglycosylase [Nocardioides gansuensis]|uniref:Lytic transglycosylase n=1 Tax=Nocardioides gansuensis TaxID=2138300 RepID=A0A2T8F7T5_9ACTN|nr:lytic transglycosylase domain-containing protein [Nocardioides gansuensis]PVG81727.1 lytic transglycosylase [Nocardioides gansuensis]